ncbi:hypothetical protein FNV43_RR04371 [Rhamnella rubrinervis]|uniref:Alkaline/neutral invertase n=1 Tax=Rhamnella rubrinervis TaxID=2594499 RepID=A0A8K0HLM8_9ROSA|nr:hypothetical protein FNV43_RR04371 [Rhamnella rubrinervis]
MKPNCRILFSCQKSSFFGFQSVKCHHSLVNHCNSSKFCLNFEHNCQFQATPFRILGFRRVSDDSQIAFRVPMWSFGQSRIISRSYSDGRCRDVSIIASVASKVRTLSTSVETRVSENNFERIYVQGGVNVKPLVVERIDKDEDIVGAEDKIEAGDENPVGTMAANDPNDKQPLNYDQVFIRDFVPSALAFLLKGEGEIVRNFLLHTLQLQSWEKTVDCYSPGQGLMPASFKVRTVPLDGNKIEEVLDPDFGESAIGVLHLWILVRLWWIILLRAYGKITGDYALQERVDVQTGLKMILNLCLTDGFDMFPSLLVTDGSCMIDRGWVSMVIPLRYKLYFTQLSMLREMLAVNDGSKNLGILLGGYEKINEIYRYKTEEYSTDAINKFNIYPEQIPSWLMDWIPEEGGYLIGNLQPAHMDFRFSLLNEAILNLIEAKWDDLVGHMPLKICYPALEYEEWRITTGSDPKNTPWSYHNGGSWPTLLWQFTLACVKMGRSDVAQKAVALAEKRLPADHWPEYYDTKTGKFIGKQSRLYQTWTIAGFLASKMLVENPEMASLLFWEEDYELLEICVCALSKSGRKKCSRGAAKSQILV